MSAELRNRHVGKAEQKMKTKAMSSDESIRSNDNTNNSKPRAIAVDDNPDNWTWAEFRYLLVRALAVVALFSVMHIMVQKVLLDPFAGLEPPFTEADAQRIANQRFK
jgi:hypothetical protein